MLCVVSALQCCTLLELGGSAAWQQAFGVQYSKQVAAPSASYCSLSCWAIPCGFPRPSVVNYIVLQTHCVHQIHDGVLRVVAPTPAQSVTSLPPALHRQASATDAITNRRTIRTPDTVTGAAATDRQTAFAGSRTRQPNAVCASQHADGLMRRYATRQKQPPAPPGLATCVHVCMQLLLTPHTHPPSRSPLRASCCVATNTDDRH